MSEMIFISIPDGELFFDIVRVCQYTVSVYANIATLNMFFMTDFTLEDFLFRWFKIKGIYTAFPISLTQFSYHLNLNWSQVLYLVLDDIFNFSCIELDCFSNIFRCNFKRFRTKRDDSGQRLHNLFTAFGNDFTF